jgi:hypothetical protein
MVRTLPLASLIAFAVLPSLTGLARADGLAEAPPVRRAWHANRHPVRHAAHPRFALRPPAFAPGPVAESDLAYGWLPRNLNLPIYNAPSDGPPPQL